MLQFKLKFSVTAFFISLIFSSFSYAKQVELNVNLANPVLKANQKQKTYLKVGLTGFKIENESKRPPVNVALVLDQSGSMQGEKIQKAKEAAIMTLNYLGKNDLFSLIVYDSYVKVLVPATKASDKDSIIAKIEKIRAGGSTALYAGVSKGVQEIRKFLSRERVNRVILLSDGQANIGPSSPGELGQFGQAVGEEGISVTTIGLGLGYNEDLMTKLAVKSDGNHAFVENATDLAKIFKYEFGDVLSVVAQEVEIEIKCLEGFKPVRVVGRESEVIGNKVKLSLNQLYSEQEKYVLIEVESPKAGASFKKKIADVSVSYSNMISKKQERLNSFARAEFTIDKTLVKAKRDKDVLEDVATQIAVENNERALELADQGDAEEAEEVLLKNEQYLSEQAKDLNSSKLRSYGASNKADAKALRGGNFKKRRKQMRKQQSQYKTQQALLI